MGFKIIWSDPAVADLEDICSYIAQDDPEAALRVARGIVAHTDTLATFPSLALFIREAPAGRFCSSFFVLTGFFTM
jgi:plasmid stabilization system protein ParE